MVALFIFGTSDCFMKLHKARTFFPQRPFLPLAIPLSLVSAASSAQVPSGIARFPTTHPSPPSGCPSCNKSYPPKTPGLEIHACIAVLRWHFRLPPFLSAGIRLLCLLACFLACFLACLLASLLACSLACLLACCVLRAACLFARLLVCLPCCLLQQHLQQMHCLCSARGFSTAAAVSWHVFCAPGLSICCLLVSCAPELRCTHASLRLQLWRCQMMMLSYDCHTSSSCFDFAARTAGVE
mmetsp:Transcript_36810/g.79803  ORF Transcript_36810/g.79803 Transcript_36810/m.79803 type:complete len:240 (-) Transcript_36810:237-956(-)